MPSCTGAASLRVLSYFSACFLGMTLLRHFLPRSLLNATISSSLVCPGAVTRGISVMALCRFPSRCHLGVGDNTTPTSGFPGRMAQEDGTSAKELFWTSSCSSPGSNQCVFRPTQEEFVEYRD